MTFARRNAPDVPLVKGPTQAGVAINAVGAVTFTALAAAWTSSDIQVDQYSELAIDLNGTTVTTSVQIQVLRKGADGAYYPIATSAVQTAAGKHSLSVGSGMANVADAVAATSVWSAAASLGDVIQIIVTPVGAFTGTLSVKGK